MVNLTKSLDALFISKVRIKVLKYFIFNPDTPIHLRGGVRELKEEINAIRRELSRLEEIQFVKSENRGNRKYFTLNHEFPMLDELIAMFHKSFGLGGAIVKNSNQLGNVKFAILTEAFTKGVELNSKIDLVLVGDVNLELLATIVAEAEAKLGREVHYTVLKETEFVLRKKRRDAFVMDIMLNNKVFLLGKSQDLAV